MASSLKVQQHYDPEKAYNMKRNIRNDNYVGLANHMSANPDVLIFRRFGCLNAQNLLRLQAKVNILENRLRDEEARLRKLYAHQAKMRQEESNRSSDALSADSQPLYLRDWESLEADALSGKEDALSYLRLFEEISVALKEYNDVLQQQQFLSGLSSPSKYDLKYLKDWLERQEYGNNFLRGFDQETYKSEDLSEDLIAAGHSPDDDPFTKYWLPKITIAWDAMIGKRLKKEEETNQGAVEYNWKWPLRVISFSATLIACMLPVGAVFALQAVPAEPETTRLGVFAGFTAGFVILMKTFTRAKRSEIFAATAAFAAVIVVFIGTNDNLNSIADSTGSV